MDILKKIMKVAFPILFIVGLIFTFFVDMPKATENIIEIVLHNIFCVWVLFLGGADWLEGTLTAGFLLHHFATRHQWSAQGIKVFTWGALFIGNVYFIFW